jgi:hypothetical protein
MKNIVAYPQEDFLFTILLGSFRRLKSKLGKQSEKSEKNESVNQYRILSFKYYSRQLRINRKKQRQT